MDLNKLFLDLKNKKFTDVELVLKDSISCLKINLHKLILSFSSEYFYK